MSVVRLIHIRIDPQDSGDAERIWKTECAPLMIQQKGCISEKLLRCNDTPGEYISDSEWETADDMEAYRVSDAHREIIEHTRNLKGADAHVKCYGLVH